MGINCVCFDKSMDASEMKTMREENETCNFNIFYYIIYIDRNIDKRILNDYKAMIFIVKLQSYARGMAMRDKIKLRSRGVRSRLPGKERIDNNGQ